MLENLGVEGRVRRALRGDFVRDGAIVFASWTLLNVLSYAVHFILSRKLGISDYGAFASIIAALAIFGIPAAITSVVMVKFVAEFHALDERGKIRVLSLRVLAGCGGLGVLLVLSAVAFRAQIAVYLHLPGTPGVIAAALSLGIGLLLPAVRGVLVGVQDFAAFAVSMSIDAIARIGLAVLFVYAGFGVAGAFAGYAVAGLLSFSYTFIAAKKHGSIIRTPLAIDARRLFVTMGGTIVGITAITFMGYIDLALVKHLFTVPDAGIYSAAAFCGKILFFVAGFVPLLILPKATQHAAGGKPTRILLQGVALTIALAGVGLGVFYLVPQMVVRITYGAAFVTAAPYIFKYGLAMSLLGATNVVVTYNIGLHRFAFVWPLLAMAITEPIAILFYHRTLANVIDALLVVNILSLALCLLSSAKAPRSASAASAGSEMAQGYTVSA